MEENEALSSQDAVRSFDRLCESRIGFRFASETDAEQWEQDGRVDDVRQTLFDASWLPDR